MAKGRKTGGRQKGVPNKATADVRAMAQAYTEQAFAALVKALRDPMQYVAAAKLLLAYGHGAPRAAIDVTVKPVYVIADRHLSPDEWAAKYASRPAVDAPGRAAKRPR